jgi:NADH:ubiquinone oxidoreductase subunit 6 (subunit J)
MGITQILFILLSADGVGSAVNGDHRKNPVHSVLYLVVTFFAISGHYILLNAQFLSSRKYHCLCGCHYGIVLICGNADEPECR